MAWLQKLYETYEACAAVLPPIAHTTQQAHVEIVLDGIGNFRRASLVSKEANSPLVPCTEESGGRTGKRPPNHPLCDKLQYVAGDFTDFGGEVTSGFASDPKEPHRSYLRALEEWAGSAHGHPKVDAVLAYVRKGRVFQDLVSAGIIPVDANRKVLKAWEGNNREAPGIYRLVEEPEDAFVCWRVETPGDPLSAVWEDQTLWHAWMAYESQQATNLGLCMVTGEQVRLADQHPAKLRNAGDKAKLISSNDTSGFTFRGRFLEASQACGIGFEASQKAHIALRWLIDRQGYRNGDEVFVAWAPNAKSIPDPFADSFRLFGGEVSENTDSTPDVGQGFARRLARKIAGYHAELGPATSIVMMGIDSATPGRMAITYFRELTGSEFLQRIESWHRSMAWHQNFGRDMTFVGAPAPRDIAEAAYGRRPRDKSHGKLLKATVDRLLPCIVEGQPIPRDLVVSATQRVINRQGLDPWEFEKNLGITCALICGFHPEEAYSMALESTRTSRSYLFGRLLALAEHMESRALYISGEKRDTMSAKLMQRFADHPSATWRTIELALIPYKTRLRAKRGAFLHHMETRLDEVISAFDPTDFVNNQRLEAEFLLGYHCERTHLRSESSAAPENNPTESAND